MEGGPKVMMAVRQAQGVAKDQKGEGICERAL